MHYATCWLICPFPNPPASGAHHHVRHHNFGPNFGVILFSSPRLVADLLRGYLNDPWLNRIAQAHTEELLRWGLQGIDAPTLDDVFA